MHWLPSLNVGLKWANSSHLCDLDYAARRYPVGYVT